MRIVAAVLGLLLAAAARGEELKIRQSVRAGFAVSEYRLTDLGGDGRADLLLVGRAGEVRTWATAAETGRLEDEPRGRLSLRDPRHSLFALADFLGEGRVQLVVIDRRGAAAHRLEADGTFSPTGVTLSSRARFRLRTGAPVLADVVQDVNGDDRPDLVLPGPEGYELWLHERGGAGPALRKAARVEVAIEPTQDMDADRLSDLLTSHVFVPRLEIVDLNDDGRSDLVVERREVHTFHMQRPDGDIPPEPDVRLDLNRFRDTTPDPGIGPGRIVAGSRRPRFQRGDLDGDSIPDYVIAHRRKVWVFHGNRDKPQFAAPTSVLKVPDVVTAMLVRPLDEDPYPDLLMLKLEMPSITGLIVGALGSLEVDVVVVGYASKKGKTFSRKPTWRARHSIRLPSIVSMLKDPGALLHRFEEVTARFHRRRLADLDGDGTAETLLTDPRNRRLDLWRGRREDEGRDFATSFRRMLFEGTDRDWDLDRLLGAFVAMAQQSTSRWTGGEEADASLSLRDPERFDFLGYAAADLDGDGQNELVVGYQPRDRTKLPVFDVVKLDD